MKSIMEDDDGIFVWKSPSLYFLSFGFISVNILSEKKLLPYHCRLMLYRLYAICRGFPKFYCKSPMAYYFFPSACMFP